MDKKLLSYIIFSIVLLSFLYKLKQKNKKAKMETKIIGGIKKVSDIFGRDIAKRVEQIYRLETTHFKSSQFKTGFSAGMEQFGKSFPYGWTSLKPFVLTFPEYKPTGVTEPIKEGQNTGKFKQFVKFPSVESAMMFLAATLKSRGDNWASWHSNNEDAKKEYVKRLDTIIPIYLNSIA